MFAACLAIVSCSSSPNPAASDALKSLRKLSGAAQVGSNLQEYTSRLIDAKAEVDEKAAQLPEGELKQEIKSALEAYTDAKTIWAVFGRGYVDETLEPGKSIISKYNVPKGSNYTSGRDLETTLSTIWQAADKHIEKATELNNKK